MANKQVIIWLSRQRKSGQRRLSVCWDGIARPQSAGWGRWLVTSTRQWWSCVWSTASSFGLQSAGKMLINCRI